MSETTDQRICIKFCVANEINFTQTLDMLRKAFPEDALSRTRVFEWHKAFKQGREAVVDDPRSGRPSTSTDEDHVAQVKALVLDNRRMSVRELAAEVGISKTQCHVILTDILDMKRVASRMVPKTLNILQREHRKMVATEMLANVDSDPNFMKRIITGDETWVYEYDMETAQQSSEWRLKNEPKPKRPRQSKSKVKVLLTVFFDYEGVVHYEFLPEGQSVNKEYYLSVLRRLREAIRKKRPNLWQTNSWLLHHDNAPAHTSKLVREYLTKNSVSIVPQAPYSPDMAPADFFLFAKLKLPLRGRRFESIPSIKENSLRELKAIPQSAFEGAFEGWIKRWHMCIASNGEYFEGDKINFDE